MIAAIDAVLAIVALGAIVIILVMLAIAFIPFRDVRTDEVTARPPGTQAKQPVLTQRRRRPASETWRVGFQAWNALKETISGRLQPWARRTWSEDHGEIPASALIVACSVVFGYVIVHM